MGYAPHQCRTADQARADKRKIGRSDDADPDSTVTSRVRVHEDRQDHNVIFTTAGKPIRDNNILARFIKPAARKLGLGWVNWRSLRTSHAVWLKMAGADVKDAQGQMRHSRATTTLDIYQQFVPESQKRVVDKLRQSQQHDQLCQKGIAANCSQGARFGTCK